VLEFRAVAADLEAFERLVGSLKRVSVDAWLSAMPASVVKSVNRPAVVREMLAGIPLPPGFDAARLEQGSILKDRYATEPPPSARSRRCRPPRRGRSSRR